MLHKRGAAYSQDLRERVFAKAAEGARVGAIARALHVTSSYIESVGPAAQHGRTDRPAAALPRAAEARSALQQYAPAR